ncbi:MAG: hypothetical protein IJ685_07055 [Selenomonadaceae bacterium]|nr:hypothetical protein [Selenomonadaceae bacterium]
MSLRDSIKDLRRVAKNLDAANFNPQMNALEEFLNGIEVDKPVEPPADVLKPLLEKFLRGERDFSSREIRALPFIIYDKQITSHNTAEILRMPDFSKSSHLRGVLNAYLSNYDDSNKTELLRQKLYGLREVDSVSLKKTFAARDKLFGNERFTNMAKFFVQTSSVNKALEAIGLSNYKASNFIQTSLKIFFRSNLSPAAQFEILGELDKEFDIYQNIFPAVADALIQTVYRTGFGKTKCIEIFYRRLGDPRFGKSRFNWNSVSQKSKDIFCHWLSEEDLETFFNIVAQTSNDKQWSYREKFWRAYLPDITNTWIFLTGNAKQFAAQSKLSHGTLTNGGGNQAVFVFQIGEYIFSEWSNIGKVRAYDSSWQEIFFGRREISGIFIRENFIAEWIHSSPQTNYWQHEVGNWIAANC